jgi:hypothetical protein
MRHSLEDRFCGIMSFSCVEVDVHIVVHVRGPAHFLAYWNRTGVVVDLSNYN